MYFFAAAAFSSSVFGHGPNTGPLDAPEAETPSGAFLEDQTQNNKGTVKEKDTEMCLFELAVARVSYVAALTLARQGYIH